MIKKKKNRKIYYNPRLILISISKNEIQFFQEIIKFRKVYLIKQSKIKSRSRNKSRSMMSRDRNNSNSSSSRKSYKKSILSMIAKNL
jgi:hypothetical protein